MYRDVQLPNAQLLENRPKSSKKYGQ